VKRKKEKGGERANVERGTKNVEPRKACVLRQGSEPLKTEGNLDRINMINGIGEGAKRKGSSRSIESTAVPSLHNHLNSVNPVQDSAAVPDDADEFSVEQREGESAASYNKRSHAAFVARLERKRQGWLADPSPRPNPLLQMDEAQSSKLFMWLRECPFNESVRQMLADQGIHDVTDGELNDFFASEANSHWERKLQRAATEANALVSLVEQNPTKFSSGILAALGQEAFRQIASGEVAPEAMTRMTNLFLKARGDERADQLMELRREKMRREWHGQTEKALEAFAGEIEKHPAARSAFEALRAELLKKEGE
jgi:hypothetical protein